MLLLVDLLYDLVLMHSDDSEQFAACLYEWLTTGNPYNKLAVHVFRYDEDVLPGQRECNSVILGLYTCCYYVQ